MCGLAGVPGTPSQLCASGSGHRSRHGAFPGRRFAGAALTGLALLSVWWLPVAAAQAASYPPALGCAVSGTAAADGLLTVRGMGFRAGSAVLVSVAGQRTGRTVADSAGSFEAAWPVTGTPAAGTTLRAAGPDCAVTGRLTVQHRPADPAQPVPPAEPAITAIPVARLTGLPPQLFLGLAGAVLLAGAGLTGLTGRLGHRSEARPAAATAVAGAGRQYLDDVDDQR